MCAQGGPGRGARGRADRGFVRSSCSLPRAPTAPQGTHLRPPPPRAADRADSRRPYWAGGPWEGPQILPRGGPCRASMHNLGGRAGGLQTLLQEAECLDVSPLRAGAVRCGRALARGALGEGEAPTQAPAPLAPSGKYGQPSWPRPCLPLPVAGRLTRTPGQSLTRNRHSPVDVQLAQIQSSESPEQFLHSYLSDL